MSSSTQAYTESWLVGPQSTTFYTRTYLPAASQDSERAPKPKPEPRAVIVFIHGYAEHIGRYIHFHPLLAARGVAVFAFDQRGFGRTAVGTTGAESASRASEYGQSSWSEQMEDIAWAVGYASKEFEGTPLFLMGHSMGGELVLGFGAQGPEGTHLASLHDLSGIISTSPLIAQTHPASGAVKWAAWALSTVAPRMLVPSPAEGAHMAHDPEVFGMYERDPLNRMEGSLKLVTDMFTKADWLLSTGHTLWPKTIPVLIIHGDADQVTSQKASKAFYDALPEGTVKRYALFEDGYHELHNEPEETRRKLEDEIVGFVGAHLGEPAEMLTTEDGSAGVLNVV